MCLYVIGGSRSVNSACGVNFDFSFLEACFRGDVGNILGVTILVVRAAVGGSPRQVGPVVGNGSKG